MHKDKQECSYQECNFNLSSFFLGVLLMLVGLLFLGQNLEWFEVDFYIDWGLIWPVLIILIGMSLIKLRGLAGTILGVALSLVIIIIILLTVFGLAGDWGFL